MFRIFLLSLSLVGLIGCSATTIPPGSGFLGDPSVYSALRDHPQFEGVRVAHYRPTETIRGASFIIPPVKLYLNSEGRDREIARAELTDLAVFFHNKVFEKLSGQYRITHVPGPGVYILRLALTDANPNIPALNIHPGTALTGAGLGGATVEMAVEESTTGELVMVATGSKKGKGYRYAAGLTKWGHTEEVLNDFAGLIRQRLDEINGPVEAGR